MTQTFISHSHDDQESYSSLCKVLDDAGISRWDPTKMVAGQPLSVQLRKAIDQCYTCVFLATPNSLQSSWCHAEVGAFWGSGKQVVIFLDCGVTQADLPPQFNGDLRAKKANQLVRAIRKAYSSEQHYDLTGTWQCEWRISQGANYTIEDDAVHIELVSGERIAAYGHNDDFGDYKLKGRVSKSGLVTFTYEGVGRQQPRGGVVIMDLEVERQSMAGYWIEYTRDRTFITGETKWIWQSR